MTYSHERVVLFITRLVKSTSQSARQMKMLSLVALISATNISGLMVSPQRFESVQAARSAFVDEHIKLAIDRPSPVVGFVAHSVDIKVEESVSEKNAREQREQQLQSQLVTNRTVLARETLQRSSGPSQEEKRTIVKQIAGAHGIDWKILEAVWEVESGKSWDRSVTSYAGAQGPMQFLPSTFRHYAPEGASITSAHDSLNAGASLLSAAGASTGDVDSALFSYNHSSAYVAKVKRVADSIQ
ncbi:hypothetical protein COT79_02650 [Candidatus Berkelbacteria bacterium CG10_big_fil_rev_8_21_14_0_10_43_14]|uniref:Transglycosylase SLT domain-containing protein n=1 Tax=Candidatus Berkelbacteria bacterium CG10_big_fil_rev_8_21_14_0_10_43_14 TaxID=1974515 RepID=A0A2M6R849_9BACT|nr:MAG: hypothetical protein COT79_02650 [Candidatus Berkelbacteria bacterium CG10_big_fil_rev_8_21_14_0_10_43_14]